ncbi:MAG: hypothetical protein HYV32_05875 [Candidatus Kerfeldbacteria bacterium]|nr:hypothetical protein [Candidatus Kerfeldbacteria bacterium]
MQHENWSIRTQVPESDAVYIKERKNSRRFASSRVFARVGMQIYERNKQDIEHVQQQNNELQQELDSVGHSNLSTESIQSRISHNTKLIEQLKKEMSEFIRAPFLRMVQNLEQLFIYDKFERARGFVMSEIQQMFGASGIRAELQKHFGNDFSQFTASNLYGKIADGSISDDLLFAVAKQHSEHVQQQEEQLEQFVQQTKQEFKQAVKEAVTNGWLPQEAENALSRIDDVTVCLQDKMEDILSSKLGDHSDTGKITVSNEQLQPKLLTRLRKTIFHELLHEIAGKSINIYTKQDNPLSSVHDLLSRKSGVVVKKYDSWEMKFNWLNEAITEWLAVRLSGYDDDQQENAYKGSTSYVDERKELDRLFDNGLLEQVVTSAYFENVNTNIPSEERNQHFIQLIDQVNAIEGRSGFMKLEHEFIMRDVERTLYGRYLICNADTARSISADYNQFEINVQVGRGKDSTIQKKLFFLAQPIDVGTEIISVEEQFKSVEKSFLYLQAVHGGKLHFETRRLH